MLQKTQEDRETLQNKEPFDRLTRCDQCGAQAYYGAMKGASSLYFCIHHYRNNEVGLIGSGFVIDDRSWALAS